MSAKGEQYSPLLSEQDVEEGHERRPSWYKARNGYVLCAQWSYIALMHVVLLLLAGALYLSLHPVQAVNDYKIWAEELPFARDAVEYETVVFAASGFNKGGPATIFEGPRTPENDELWYNLTKVGMYSLTEDEYSQLDLNTTKVAGKPEQRLITIEVFHQLHCLNYLRRRIYEENGEHFQVETDQSRSMHLTHCIDYLRQVLMCHGDLTPITLELQPGFYMPNFEIKHTCRNFDRIYEFATERNISGIGIE